MPRSARVLISGCCSDALAVARRRTASGSWCRSLGGGPKAQIDGCGAEVRAHYANYARVELAAFDAAVTDWELHRSFERL